MSHDDSEYLGKTLGNWSVIGTGFSVGKHRAFVVRCKCGAHGKINKASIVRGLSTKCKNCRALAGDKNPKWRGHKDVPQHTYSIMCRAAAVRGIPVEVTIEDLQEQYEKQGGRCALTGLPIRIGSLKTGREASVDRIDNARGYTKDNIQWVHKDVNLMKNKFNEDYFYGMCKLVVNNREARCQTP